MKKISKYLPFLIIGGIVYFITQRFVFAKEKTGKNELTEYFKKLFGDKEKQIQSESPEKLMYNVR